MGLGRAPGRVSKLGGRLGDRVRGFRCKGTGPLQGILPRLGVKLEPCRGFCLLRGIIMIQDRVHNGGRILVGAAWRACKLHGGSSFLGWDAQYVSRRDP